MELIHRKENLKNKREALKTLLKVVEKLNAQVAEFESEDFPGRVMVTATEAMYRKRDLVHTKIKQELQAIAELEASLTVPKVVPRKSAAVQIYERLAALKSEAESTGYLLITKGRLVSMGLDQLCPWPGIVEIKLVDGEVLVIYEGTYRMVLEAGVLRGEKAEGMKKPVMDMVDTLQSCLNALRLETIKHQDHDHSNSASAGTSGSLHSPSNR